MLYNINNLEKSKIYNIFIVRTPFQLINAYEAMEYFKTNNNVLIILDHGTQNNKQQLTDLIYDGFWKEVIRFGSEMKSNFFNYIKLIQKLKIIKINYLFIGSGFNKMQRLLVANINSTKTCFFDSGMNTITTYNNFINDNINIFSFKLLRFKIMGLKTKVNKNIDFFTMYNLKSCSKIKIFKNNYDFMKNRFSNNNKTKKEIYIIGQRIVSTKVVTQEVYFNYLDTIFSTFCSDYKINYLMHRNEDENYLIKKYSKKINFIKSTMPGELFFLSLKYKPEYICGTVSTLMISLKYIFKDINIISYQFNSSDILKNYSFYKNEYENMKKNQITIKKLKG